LTRQVWLGESLRWYLTQARHPLKNYVVGHYWAWFCKPRVWIKYDETSAINVSLGDYLQQRIFFEGYYERILVEWLKRTLQPDDVFWDVGANIGAVTLVAARLCRRVVAFEPDPRSLQVLTRNVRTNRMENVEIIPAALGEGDGTAILHQAAALNTGMSSLLPLQGGTIGNVQVQVIAADQMIEARPELSPTVMKLDVEGAEHLVLRGAARMLRNRRIRAIVFEDRCGSDGRPANQALLDSFRDAHYEIQPFGTSDESANDGMRNFLATSAASVEPAPERRTVSALA